MAAALGVLGVLPSATTVSAASLLAAETRVGASTFASPVAVGFEVGVWASRHQEHGPLQAETVATIGVAANALPALPKAL